MFKMITLIAAMTAAVHAVHLSNEASREAVFFRSEKVHQESMAVMTRSMTMPKAIDILEKNKLTSPALLEATNMILKASSNLRGLAIPTTANLTTAENDRQNAGNTGVGYSGIDGARQLLNDMIHESMSKYDREISECTQDYSDRCVAMEACRSEMSAANYLAANSRALILDAVGMINYCEVSIPELKLELSQHNLKCEHEMNVMHTRRMILEGDIAIMATILEMTDCLEKKNATNDAKIRAAGSNTLLLHCQDQCTQKSFVKFENNALQDKIGGLKSAVARNLLKDTFKDLYKGVEGLEGAEFFQTEAHQIPNKTKFNTPPLPRTQVPGNPCNDPNAGAPKMSKRASKCALDPAGTPCFVLQERFILIQAGIMDERDTILDDMDWWHGWCKETQATISHSLANDEISLEQAQTKEAVATEKVAINTDISETWAKKHEEENQGMVIKMASCTKNYAGYENEICALKKIRSELYKMKGGGHSSFFTDCQVSKWEPEECSKECNGGEQTLLRKKLVVEDRGAICLPLEAVRSCNMQPCPVNCKLFAWSSWSKCTAECGGGVKQRLREVDIAMKHQGNPCGQTSETLPCNIQGCEKDCELHPWTKWSACSKDCDGGTRKRMRFIKKPAEGQGKCNDEWDTQRLQYKKCSMKRCETSDAHTPMHCSNGRNKDIIILLDGSGSLRQNGWNSEKKAALNLVDAFDSGSSGKVKMAVILFSGPRTWYGVKRCFYGYKGWTLARCGITTVTHFTDDLTLVKTKIDKLKWPKGTTFTSTAMELALAETGMGRPGVKTDVVVFTDGRPLSYKKTKESAVRLRKVARLLFVPILLSKTPLANIKAWATRRWQENVVEAKNFEQLVSAETITHLVADMCEPQSADPERHDAIVTSNFTKIHESHQP